MNIWKSTRMHLFNRPVLYCFLCLKLIHEVFSVLTVFYLIFRHTNGKSSVLCMLICTILDM